MQARAFLLMFLLAMNGMATDAIPPSGFLEFLGSMVEQDGELVDPLTLETSADEALTSLSAKQNGTQIESDNDSKVDVEDE